MQKFINRASPDVLDDLMCLLKGKFSRLLMDTYGNYFCQKLIQTCTAEQRTILLKDVTITLINRYKVTLKLFLVTHVELMPYSHLLKS
jgi:hypothetical protein